MRALALAAGMGSRLGPLTSQQNKCLLRCGGQAIIDQVLDSASRIAEITEIVVVVGYRGEDVVRHLRHHPPATPVIIVRQPEQHGLVDAVDCARRWVEDDDVLLLLGDEVLIHPQYDAFIDDFRANNYCASVGSLPTTDLSRVRKTYTFSYEGHEVRQLIEKPTTALSPRMGTGSVLFSKGSLTYLDLTAPNPVRGERDLAGVLQAMVDCGRKVGWFDVCDEFVNVNTPEDLRNARGLAGSSGQLAESR